MCEFLSCWKLNYGTLRYLTDHEVYSLNGRERLKGCRDNDVLGHGSVKAYYVEYASEKWKAKAWAQLLTQPPTNSDLIYIVKYASEKWKVKAAAQLLTQSPTNDDLIYIVKYAPEKWKVKAAAQLLTQSPTNNDLIYIVEYAPEKWKMKARNILKN